MIFKIKCIAYLLLLLAYTTLRIFDLTCIMRLIIFMVSFGLVAQVNAGRWDKYAENYKAGRNKVRALRGTVGGADQLRGDVSGSKHYAAALDVDGNDNTDQHGKLKVSDGATYIGDLNRACLRDMVLSTLAMEIFTLVTFSTVNIVAMESSHRNRQAIDSMENSKRVQSTGSVYLLVRMETNTREILSRGYSTAL
jgi:hypothetical protein